MARKNPITKTPTMAERQRRKFRTQLSVGLVATAILMVATYVGFTHLTATAAGCDTLAESTSGTGTAVSLAVELQGNTAADAAAVSDFVANQLSAVAGDVASPFEVNLTLIAAGKPIKPSGCLSSGRMLTSPEGDLDVYTKKSTSELTRQRLGKSLAAVRAEQIGWIASAAGGSVRQVDFGDSDPRKPVLSPRIAWTGVTAADDPAGIVALFSPMVSTVPDCFASKVVHNAKPVGHPNSVGGVGTADGAGEQVRDCVAFDQVGKATADKTSVVVADADLDTAQRELAHAVARELCIQATEDRCSATPKVGEPRN